MASREFIDASQLSDLRTALRHVSDEVADVVESLLEDMAKQVATNARARVPYRTGRAQSSYRARGATVTFGDGVPYVPWLEFGGKVGRKESVRRPYNRKGRYLYPAIADNAADIAKQVADLIEQITGGYIEIEGQ